MTARRDLPEKTGPRTKLPVFSLDFLFPDLFRNWPAHLPTLADDSEALGWAVRFAMHPEAFGDGNGLGDTAGRHYAKAPDFFLAVVSEIRNALASSTDKQEVLRYWLGLTPANFNRTAARLAAEANRLFDRPTIESLPFTVHDIYAVRRFFRKGGTLREFPKDWPWHKVEDWRKPGKA